MRIQRRLISTASIFASRGMRLRTRWFFEPGTELSVNFQLADIAAGSHRAGRILRTEGYVVECQPMHGGADGYEVTVAFWEVTDDILAIIRDVAARERHPRVG